jgi:NADPH:quinone reductase-like Zn-dependent oxidoreductase
MLVRVVAAPINQLDLLIGSGRFYGAAPQPPYVPGVEGVGTVVEADALEPGSRVWFSFERFDGGLGSLGELCAIDEDRVFAIRHDINDMLAAGLGLTGVAAWMALSWRARVNEGEQVLVLGGAGAVGQVALQAAGLLGAGRVIAASRSEEGRVAAKQLGADAVVDSSGDDMEVISDRILAACDGPLTLVIDPVWGEHAAAALRALSPNGRLVNFGGSGGSLATLDSATIRSKSLSVLGYTNLSLTFEQITGAIDVVHEHAAAGRLRILYESVALEDAAGAWRRASESLHRKLIVTP